MKINLASGQRPYPKPWINIDIREQGYPVDILADITKLDMIEDNSVEIAVAHHVLEHIEMSKIGDVAKEWNRIIMPGGKLLVCVPNNKALAQKYLNGEIDDFIYNVNMYGAYQGHIEDLHRWSYNFEYLSKQMGGNDMWAGIREFNRNIQASDTRYSGADIALDWWILAVEFTKK